MTTTKASPTSVRSVSPCLTFRDRAEEAVNLYVSTFKNSKVTEMVRSESDGPIPKGKLLHATFELNGHEYTAFDGGEHFTFSQGISLVATCDTQDELDAVWNKLSSDGGKEGPCGWLTDKFGVSWQIVPAALGKMMSDTKSGSPAKVMGALMKMSKLDIQTLEKAYRS
jgi:predicted 3-demethylubiquinone-9 3-methyltransferase (glyoxalase superfamily)